MFQGCFENEGFLSDFPWPSIILKPLAYPKHELLFRKLLLFGLPHLFPETPSSTDMDAHIREVFSAAAGPDTQAEGLAANHSRTS